MLFRKAKQEEVKEIAALYDAVKSGKFTPWNEEYPLEEDAQGDVDAGLLYVLESRGKIAAVISEVHDDGVNGLGFWKAHENPCEIARVAVAPEYQGQGLSLVLVTEFEREMRRKGFRVMYLLVDEHNVPAFRTYLRAGFEIRGKTYMYEHDYVACEKVMTEENAPAAGEGLPRINSGRYGNEKMLCGGWTARKEQREMEEHALAVFEEAMETYADATLTPIACIATQVVAGINYAIVCFRGAEKVIVTVYSPVCGEKASVVSVTPLQTSSLSKYYLGF